MGSMNIFRSSYLPSLYLRVKKEILSLALSRPVILVTQTILKLCSFEPATPTALRKTYSDVSIAKVVESSIFKTISPCFADCPPQFAVGTYKHINAYRLRRAIVSTYSPVYSISRQLIFPDHILEQVDRVRTDPSGIYREAAKCHLFRTTRFDRYIVRGIHVGGAGAFNWFHFLLECLPKVLLADKLPAAFSDYPLLAPVECQHIDTFKEAFNLVSKGKTALFLNRSELALVNDLIVFDEISTAPFNMIPSAWPRLNDYRQCDYILLELIAELRKSLNPKIETLNRPKRLFLVRPGERRSYNQKQLVEIAANYGFEPVSPELLSLREQATIFNGASAIIGASGAAWVGIIFAEQPVTGLSWLPPEYREFCSYSTLASLLGHRLRFIDCKPSHRLASTADSYTASYTVSPSIFEESLCALIHQLP